MQSILYEVSRWIEKKTTFSWYCHYVSELPYKQENNKTQTLPNFKTLRNNIGPWKESLLYSNELTEEDTEYQRDITHGEHKTVSWDAAHTQKKKKTRKPSSYMGSP